MKEYDIIAVGTGSVMDIINAVLQVNPRTRIAVIDKDEPGGICLTRGCIPSKILVYPAELVRVIEKARDLGVNADIKKVDFERVMQRMRTIIGAEITAIQKGLTHTPNLDYYSMAAEFTAPYTLKVGNETITAKLIILGAGSKPEIPPIKNMEKTGYLTSDTVLKLTKMPKRLAIIGGGYIAAEYGHFFAAMGSQVTIIGRNPQFLPDEEPEISFVAKRELQKHLTILTNHEVREAEKTASVLKKLTAVNRENGKPVEITAEEILVATGRISNADVLKPENGGIKTDKDGWIVVNEFLETSQPGVWALGDADGKYPFKHKANYEAQIVYYNAIQKRMVKADYHAVPHAVFTYPEVASVGLKEKEAIEQFGKDNILIGSHRYEDTAKGEVMGVKDFMVKVIVERDNMKILGAHIVGPYASTLIQEVINLMYTPSQNAYPMLDAMHIHPALSEVVQKAFDELGPPDVYHHVLEHHYEIRL